MSRFAAPGSPLHKYGEVHLSFVTSYDPSHAFLAPFALHRQVLGVLGLGSFRHDADRSALERAPSALRELHPHAIVHRAYIFDTAAGGGSRNHSRASSRHPRNTSAASGGGGDSQPDPSSSSQEAEAEETFKADDASHVVGFSDRGNSGLIIFPAIRRDGKDVRFYLRTLLREFVGSLLDGLDSIVSGLEGKPLETPRETLDGFATGATASSSAAMSPSSSSSSAVSPPGAASSAASRASSFFSSFGSSSAPSSNNAIGGGMQPSALSPGSDGASKTPLSRSSASASAKNQPKRTNSMVGAGPTGSGRYAKVKADYSLLCGDLWAAITLYDSCLTWLGKERAVAGGQDAVWYASALEHWAVTRCLIFRMSGLEEKGPSLTLPTGGAKEKDKKENETFELPFARFEWGQVAEAYALALQIYSKTLAPPRYLVESVRSVNPDTPRDYTHPLIHASACIAYSRLLLAVWASGGWNAECFDQLIYGGVPPSLVEDARPGPAMYASLSKASGVQRHEIAAPASLGLTHSVAALKPPDQIHILCSLANIYGCAGFPRREAYLLRQLQATVVSLLARALILHPREPVTISSALKQIAGSDHTVLGTLVSQTLTSGLGQSADAVLILALQICETYGINVDVDPLRKLPAHHVLSKAAQTGKKSATGEPLLKKKNRASWGAQAMLSATGPDADVSVLQDEADFGWADLQIALLKDTICVAEMLQDHVGMAFFATILVRDFHELLSAGEQQSLIRGLQACVRTARTQDAHDLEVQYWGPAEPLCSLETVPLSPARLAVERPAKDLIVAESDKDAGLSTQAPAGSQNPFFWNPTTSSNIAAKQSVLVQDEKATFFVTLQNPFKTHLELSAIRLSTDGARFDADTLETALPPLALHTLALTGTPRESGNLTVRGIFLTLQGCKEREFKVPLYDEASDKQRQQRDAALDDRRTRLKTHGLDARPAIVAQRRAARAAEGDAKPASKKNGSLHGLTSSGGAEKFVSCRVIPSQPQLMIDSPTLSHGQILLYEGEESTLRVRLTNSSPLPIDFVQITTTDDLSEAIQSSLAEGDLLPEDVHQLEHQLVHSPVFSGIPSRPRSIKIPPHGRSVTIPIKIRGKIDCSRGVVNVDFGYLNAPGRGGLPTEETKNFFTRRVTLPFAISVVPLVECGPIDVRDIGHAEARLLRARLEGGDQQQQQGVEGALRGLQLSQSGSKLQPHSTQVHAQLNGQHSDGSAETSSSEAACLLTMDVRNLFDHPLVVTLRLGDEPKDIKTDGEVVSSSKGASALSVSRAILAGHTSSFAIPLAKFELPESLLSSPIPSLSSRQFIVSKVKLTPQEEAAVRRRFWYRQALLSRLSGTWTDTRSGKTGRLSLEEQEVTDRLVLRLREDPVEVRLDLQSNAGEPLAATTKTDAVVTHTTSESFHTVVSHVTNRSNRPVRLLYRLVPLPSTAIDAWSAGGGSGSSGGGGGGGNAPEAGSNGAGPNQALHASGIHSSDATLSQLLITDGGLACPLKPWPLEVGQTTSVRTGVAFLASGQFAFTASVEEAFDLTGGGSGAGGSGEENAERLVRIARQQLVVNVSGPDNT